MNKWSQRKIYGLAAGLILVATILILTLTGFQNSFIWRWEVLTTYVRGIIRPVESIPTAVHVQEDLNEPTIVFPTASPTMSNPELTLTVAPEQTQESTPELTFTKTPVPERVILTSPRHEKQDINNCGPATLAMYLRYYGWDGDQFTISDIIKPIPQDRNVNVEELDFFTRNYAGWLQTLYRVGGDIDTLKEFVAAGIPVMIEESFTFEEYYWPNDDRWAGHYLLINGYDDQRQSFLSQDSYYGEDRWVSYEVVNSQWQSFNYVYIIVFLPEQETTVRSILGDQWDQDVNRQYALEKAQQETVDDPDNVFTWFNLGSNLVYFGEYRDATNAFDKAREIGWPQRMLRYQFSPLIAYFQSLRNEDLLTLADYALERTPNSEEAMLWKGWGLYRDGYKQEALDLFLQALEVHPGYEDANYAINYVNQN